MEIATAKFENDVVYISLKGRISSTNAAQAENEINEILAQQNGRAVIVDAEELEYISSAGLRVVLRIRKAVPELKIINVSAEVYEIFEMTGFTEMITIEKAYRKISVENCEVIGQGANGKVYRLDPETIIKVYYNPDSLPDIQRERDLARRAFVLGVPTAIPYDIVRVGNSYGSVFELLSAASVTKKLAAHPEKTDELVAMTVDLLKKIHSTEVLTDDVPDMKATVLKWADFLKDYLPEEKWQKLHSLVEAVPKSNNMLHGDFHAKNVMFHDGEMLLIDMDTLAKGDPVFEFASIFNAYVGFLALCDESISSFVGLPYQQSHYVWRKTLELYFNTDDDEVLSEVENKAALIGYTRLMRRLIRRNGLNDPENKKKIEYYKAQIIELLDKVDTLKLS